VKVTKGLTATAWSHSPVNFWMVQRCRAGWCGALVSCRQETRTSGHTSTDAAQDTPRTAASGRGQQGL